MSDTPLSEVDLRDAPLSDAALGEAGLRAVSARETPFIETLIDARDAARRAGLTRAAEHLDDAILVAVSERYEALDALCGSDDPAARRRALEMLAL